ncbi:hypothetical protein K432DRAFT_436955 [Lepidopterella palustris CBS 459.81]|uniref:NADH-ubiquinone oxidoreductase 299 kDa subunit n=1 Tax=Lepidopterella palustris CBS 459.81 TaxID=1314670 RepID=A0A8E2E3B4_9PEZI|nr:hypothetical protein K432DRAFT_436955 [Lepidopterella palustris CBS 459.81]
MRSASRLFAGVKAGRFLEPGTPTGLCGLYTHPSPRSTLIYLYSSTLDKLRQLPETSVYRQSTEALTKHRLQIVEAALPQGFDAWQDKVQMQLAESPNAFEGVKYSKDGKPFVATIPTEKKVDPRADSWDGEKIEAHKEGIRGTQEGLKLAAKILEPIDTERTQKIELDPEPQLTIDQISDLESQIGAGLIEEVIQVAHGEHALVDKMIESKAWEELVEKAPEGQWAYFERGGSHTSTQKP